MPIWGHNIHNQRPCAELGEALLASHGTSAVGLGVNLLVEEAFGSGDCLARTGSHLHLLYPALSAAVAVVSAQWLWYHATKLSAPSRSFLF